MSFAWLTYPVHLLSPILLTYGHTNHGSFYFTLAARHIHTHTDLARIDQTLAKPRKKKSEIIMPRNAKRKNVSGPQGIHGPKRQRTACAEQASFGGTADKQFGDHDEQHVTAGGQETAGNNDLGHDLLQAAESGDWSGKMDAILIDNLEQRCCSWFSRTWA